MAFWGSKIGVLGGQNGRFGSKTPKNTPFSAWITLLGPPLWTPPLKGNPMPPLGNAKNAIFFQVLPPHFLEVFRIAKKSFEGFWGGSGGGSPPITLFPSQKQPIFRGFWGFWGHFQGFWGHFYQFLVIFIDFWSFLTPKTSFLSFFWSKTRFFRFLGQKIDFFGQKHDFQVKN